MSFVLGFNLLVTPITMLWPELFPSPSYSLWLIEASFLVSIVFKAFSKKPKSTATDTYEVFVEYLKSNFVLDIASTIPNVFSGMNPQFTFLKIIRVYEIDQLPLLLDTVFREFRPQSVKSEKDDISYALSVITKITILLHYLSCLWIYVGSPAFKDYEANLLPWQLANEDFIGMSHYEIYVFSTYWVCTVITTVGYGDYSGGTTLEYQVTLFLELFGLVVFTAL